MHPHSQGSQRGQQSGRHLEQTPGPPQGPQGHPNLGLPAPWLFKPWLWGPESLRPLALSLRTFISPNLHRAGSREQTHFTSENGAGSFPLPRGGAAGGQGTHPAICRRTRPCLSIHL